MAGLRLLVLGGPRLERDGQPIELPLRRASALLAYLAVTGRSQRRDTLAALLWPDADDREGRGRLRRTLHRLADVVGPDVVLAAGDTLSISARAGLWLDSQHFEDHAAAALSSTAGTMADPERLARASTAATLYADDFLAGFTLADSPNWDEWQFLQREHLRQLFARVLEWLVGAHQTQEEWDEALPYARRWLALDMLHEPAHRALMQLYGRAGRPAAALRQYQECVRLLRDELGVAPEPETSDLFESIRRRRLIAPAEPNAQATPAVASDPEAPRQAPVPTGAAGPPRAVDLPPSPDRGSPRPSTSPQGYPEQRRWVTVLAVQIIGLVALSEELDPEDAKALVDQSVGSLTEHLDRFGGRPISMMGDALLAVFGAPTAHEDDAERAVRAGLAMRNGSLTQAGDPYEGRLAVSVGIDTGEAMATATDTGTRGISITGGVVTSSTRLMHQAPPGAVLVGSETYRATHRRIRFREPSAISQARSGQGNTERAASGWEALEPVPEPRSRGPYTSPFVGRDRELALLVATWTKVLHEARPHLITVLGEPGIGKSRLIAEFEQRVRSTEDGLVLHGRCLPFGEALGYRVLAPALRGAAGISDEADIEAARARLEAAICRLSEAGDLDGDPQAIARQLALVAGFDSAADRDGPPVDERTLHVAVRRFIEGVARRRPICLIVEDIHWADDALLSLMEFTASRAQRARLMILTQARPELLAKRPSWGGGVRAFTSLPLEPLDDEASRSLASALCTGRGLSEELAAQVERLAGGNPLFAEELTSTFAERPENAVVPSALLALISARLDALPAQERQLVQHAAVLGKHFWVSALEALGIDGDVELLEDLEQRDLLRVQMHSRFGGDREYAFRHDLIREVAYGMLPRTERRRLHRGVVDWIERVAGDRADEHLDLLAHHAVQAEEHDRALRYLTWAARRMRHASAHREEAALLAQAIDIAARTGRADLVPDLRADRGRAFASVGLWTAAQSELQAALAGLASDRSERRAEVLVDLALACNWSMETAELKRHAGDALTLARSVGRADLAIGSGFWLAWASGSDGDVNAAVEQYERVLAEAQAIGVSPAPSVLPLYSTTLCWTGEFDRGIARARQAVQIARAGGDTDATILALQVLGLALAGTGSYDEAIQVFDEASRFGRDYGIGPFLARSIAMSAGFHLDIFDYDGHLALAEEARDVARSANFPPPHVSASIDLLLSFARRGDVSRTEHLADEVAQAVERASGWHGWLWSLRFAQARAEIALARGAYEDAIQFAEAALERSQGRRPKYQVLGLVTRAQALAQLSRTDEARADLRRAVRVARRLRDPALLLRGVSAQLDFDRDDSLVAEARSTARAILARLPTSDLRRRFQDAEPVRRLGPLGAEGPRC